eukprot:8053537-Lingulodinium_polyedra.AAC.1
MASKQYIHWLVRRARSKLSDATPCLVNMSASWRSELAHLTVTFDNEQICRIDKASIAVRFSASPNPADWLRLP